MNNTTYRIDTEHLYHAFVYSLIILLSNIMVYIGKTDSGTPELVLLSVLFLTFPTLFVGCIFRPALWCSSLHTLIFFHDTSISKNRSWVRMEMRRLAYQWANVPSFSFPGLTNWIFPQKFCLSFLLDLTCLVSCESAFFFKTNLKFFSLPKHHFCNAALSRPLKQVFFPLSNSHPNFLF